MEKHWQCEECQAVGIEGLRQSPWGLAGHLGGWGNILIESLQTVTDHFHFPLLTGQKLAISLVWSITYTHFLTRPTGSTVTLASPFMIIGVTSGMEVQFWSDSDCRGGVPGFLNAQPNGLQSRYILYLIDSFIKLWVPIRITGMWSSSIHSGGWLEATPQIPSPTSWSRPVLCCLASGVKRGRRSQAWHGKGDWEAVWQSFTLPDEWGQWDKIMARNCTFYNRLCC